MPNYDVVVVGSGVIGLSIAWRLGADGRRVALVDPHPGSGASFAAAGMLAPVTEAAWGEEPLVELNVRSATDWPAFAAALEAASGEAVGLRRCGALLVGANTSDRAVLEELYEFQCHLGLDSTWCGPSACRALEPLLAPGVRGGIHAPHDDQVDGRRLLAALGAAGRRAGVTAIVERVIAVTSAGGRVRGVQLPGQELEAPTVVLAAGYATAEIGGLPEGAGVPVRPVKGQILRLRTSDGMPLLGRTVRGIVAGRSVYIVPREDGRVVVGATVEELGTDTVCTANGCYEQLRDAIDLVPALGELELVEAAAGLRPGTPDNAPLVGEGPLVGLCIATGHYRNGILLAPVTVEIVRTVVDTGSAPAWAAPFAPGRHVRVPIGATS